MQACGSETNSSCEEGDLDITVQRLSIDNAPHDSEIDTNIHRYLKSINELLLNDEPLEPNYEDRTTDIIKESTKSTRDLIKERETQLKKWEGRVQMGHCEEKLSRLTMITGMLHKGNLQ